LTNEIPNQTSDTETVQSDLPSSEELESTPETSFDFPWRIYFNEDEDNLISFLEKACGNKEEYSATSFASELPYDHANAVAKLMQENGLPFIKGQAITYDFGGWYDVTSNTCRVTYLIDGNRYRFQYRYGEKNATIREGEPVLSNVSVGPYQVDLYQGDPTYLSGSIILKSAVLNIVIFTDQPDSVNLSHFDFYHDTDAVTQ
jgi:hypothetical protein